MIKLANILKEIRINNINKPGLVGAPFLDWVKLHKQEIANINPDYTSTIINNDEQLVNSSWWTEDDYYSDYPDYTYSDFINDWKKYEGSIVALGAELSSVFVSRIDLPPPFINVATSNDIVFNGSTPNTEKASQRYVVDNRELYLVFGIPDPGV